MADWKHQNLCDNLSYPLTKNVVLNSNVHNDLTTYLSTFQSIIEAPLSQSNLVFIRL